MRQIAIVLAVLAYLLPVGWQVALRSIEPSHGMFWVMTTAGSLVLAFGLSAVATGLLVAVRRDWSQPALGTSTLTRAEFALVAAPVVAVTLMAVAVLGSLVAA